MCLSRENVWWRGAAREEVTVFHRLSVGRGLPGFFAECKRLSAALQPGQSKTRGDFVSQGPIPIRVFSTLPPSPHGGRVSSQIVPSLVVCLRYGLDGQRSSVLGPARDSGTRLVCPP